MTATPELIYNNLACGRIKGGITASQLYADLYPGDTQLFLSQWSSGKQFYATITDAMGNIEIVKVTAISGNRITIERGQDETSARQWYDGAVINQRFNAALMDAMIQKEAQRQVAFNPNGVLTATYPHEEVFQLGQKIWWKNISGTDWIIIAGKIQILEWTEATGIPTGEYGFYDICYSSGLNKFIALVQDNSTSVWYVMASTDRNTWEMLCDLSTYNLNTASAICWAPSLNKFFIAGLITGSNYIWVGQSSDGITWDWNSTGVGGVGWGMSLTMCWSSTLSKLCLVNNQPNPQDVTLTSSDGISWSAGHSDRTISGGGIYKPIWVSDLNLFVACASGIQTSPDGLNWTYRALSKSPIASYGVAWSSSLALLCVVYARVTSQVETSPNSINWTERIGPDAAATYYDVFWEPSLESFIVVTHNETDHDIRSSSDGINWSMRETPTALGWDKVVSNGNGKLCAISHNWNYSPVIYCDSEGVEYTE